MIFTFGSIQTVEQPVRCARCCRWHRGGLGFRSSLFTLKSMAHRCQTALELEICPKNLRDLSIVKSAGRQTGRFQQPWACREGPRYSTLLLRTLMGELRHVGRNAPTSIFAKAHMGQIPLRGLIMHYGGKSSLSTTTLTLPARPRCHLFSRGARRRCSGSRF